MTRLAVLVPTLLALAGCCGSMGPAHPFASPPPLQKALDRVHDELSRKHDGLFYAGAAVVDLSPAFPIFMGGFELGRVSQGVRDPIQAHAVYLDDGRTPLVIVTLDTIGYQNDDVIEARELATDRWGDHVVIATTHDHVGPDTIGIWGKSLLGLMPLCSGRVPAYMEQVKYGIAQAIDQAALSAQPARIRAASIQVSPTLSENVHAEIATQKDDLARVLAFEGVDGRPIAVLANWGCHAEAMNNDVQLSADWPGAFYRRWQKDVGGVPVFLQGALGGLVAPNFRANRPGPLPATGHVIDEYLIENQSVAERLELSEFIGNAFAETVMAAVAGVPQPLGPEGITLTVHAKRVRLEQDNWRYTVMNRKNIVPRPSAQTSAHRNFVPTDVLAARLRAGDAVVADLVTEPGEPTPPVIEDIDATSDAPLKLNVGLGNDEIGYILRDGEFSRDVYDYERTLSLGQHTAGTLTDAIRELRKGL